MSRNCQHQRSRFAAVAGGKRIRFAATIIAALSCSVSAQGFLPAGEEFRANTFVSGSQASPRAGIDSKGNFVLVWAGNAVIARRYDGLGAPLGSDLEVSSTGARPVVAVASDGSFVVAWDSDGDGSSRGVFARRFSSQGAALGSTFRVNSYTVGGQEFPDVAIDGVGRFSIVWGSELQDGSSWGVFCQRYDSTGLAMGTEFQVNSYTSGYQGAPDAAAAASGNFVVVWEDASDHDGDGGGNFAQRFDSAGTKLGSEFQVNSYTPYYQSYSDIASDAGGNFVIVWSSYSQDGSGTGVFGRRYESTGVGLGAEFRINTHTAYDQMLPRIAMDAWGGFVVSWQSEHQDGSGYGIFAKRFDSTGTELGSEFQVNSYTSDEQSWSSVAVNEGGTNAVAVWQSYGQDGDLNGVFAQRYGFCPAKNDTDCVGGFGKGFLLIKEDLPGQPSSKNKLVAKFLKGPALAQQDLGNPLDGSQAGTGTVYALCLYDDAGDLVAELVTNRAGATCADDKPCWKAVGKAPNDPKGPGKGYKYKDKSASADGLIKILFKGGPTGRSKALVKAKGASVPTGIPAALQSSTDARIQLRASDGECLSIGLTNIAKQEDNFFKAKFSAP